MFENFWGRLTRRADKSSAPTPPPDTEPKVLYASLLENLVYIRGEFDNAQDLTIREFDTAGHRAAIVYLDNTVDKQMLNLSVNEPLSRLRAPVKDAEELFRYIREQVLYRIVLETIRQTLSYVRMFRKDFKLEMLAQDEESRKAELAEKQKALSGAKKRMEDLDRIIQHIYEDNVLGKLSDSRYLKLSRQYEKEQSEIEQLASVLEREIETQAGQVSDVNEFLKLVDKYLDIPELDAAILNELVSKIVVHSPVRENGRKQVRIDLYFTYVGQIRIPLKIGRESLNESEPAC